MRNSSLNIRFLLLFLSVGFMISCSTDYRHNDPLSADDEVTDGDAQWTVMLYGAGNYADDLLLDGQSRVISTVQGMQEVFTSEQVNVIALLASPATGGTARLYRIGYRPNDPINAISSVELANWGQMDLSSPEVFNRFVDAVVAGYPAHKYMLAIAGFGNGWKGACTDEINGSGLPMSVSNIYSTIRGITTTDGQPLQFDLVAWLAPEMGTVEVAYQFRNVADYMVASPSKTIHGHAASAGQWLLDLTLDPSMTADRLGRFVVSRIEQTALRQYDSTTTYSLYDLSNTRVLSEAIAEFSMQLQRHVHDHSGLIFEAWQAAWMPQTDDSQAVDLSAFVDAIITTRIFSDDVDLQTAAEGVRTALQSAVLEYRSTRLDEQRGGISIYFPTRTEAAEWSDYERLLFAQEQSGWKDLLVGLAESGSSWLHISGTVSRPGQTLENMYLFLNSAEFGSPVIALTVPVTLTEFVTPDVAAYQAGVVLPADSLNAYVGLFQDLDNNQTLSSGDPFGYYRRVSSLRDWVTLHNGSNLDSADVELNRRY